MRTSFRLDGALVDDRPDQPGSALEAKSVLAEKWQGSADGLREFPRLQEQAIPRFHHRSWWI
jgi:hypothetical protein